MQVAQSAVQAVWGKYKDEEASPQPFLHYSSSNQSLPILMPASPPHHPRNGHFPVIALIHQLGFWDGHG